MQAAADESLPTRQSLLVRLRNWQDQDGWQDFFDTYWKLIYHVALKAGLEENAAQDVVQETIIGVAKKIKEFEYDSRKGSFKGWLLTITRRRVSDHLRRVYASPALEVALENVKKQARLRQFQLFDCFVLKEWPMKEITEKFRVNMGQVYFAKYKITLLVERELRKLQRRWQ